MAMFPGAARLHPVALYAAIAAVSLTVALFLQLRRRKRPGDTAAIALTAVGIVQFLLTFMRQPYIDAVASSGILDPIQWVALGMIVAAGIIWLLPRKSVPYAV
jgi:phosphatidylglycerol:prolipoprotein diacylglycerol transferase